MGAIWLVNMADVLRDAGLVVVEHAGWQTRSRSSGGYDGVWAIGVHHDAVTTGTPCDDRVDYEMHNADAKPIGAAHLHTDGVWHIMAAGATNTQGKGGPYPTSRGTIPVDAGNRYMLSIEASNNGVGEPWPTTMQDSYVHGCAALADWLALDPTRDIVAHFEWTNRKIDPAGPSRYATGTASWDMDRFRRDVANYQQEDEMTQAQYDAIMKRFDEMDKRIGQQNTVGSNRYQTYTNRYENVVARFDRVDGLILDDD